MSEAIEQPAKRGLGFSLDTIDTRGGADEGAEIEIIAPDGTGTGFFLTLLGEDSKAYKAVQETNRKRVWAAAMRGTAMASPKVEDQIARSDEMALDLLVACTKGWRTSDGGPVLLHGNILEFDEFNVRLLYTEGSPIIREQAERAIKDRANFMQRSA